MFENLDIFRMSSAMAKHAGTRQAIVAENVANADTPGYKARRLPSFKEIVDTPPVGQKATRARHLHGAGDIQANARIAVERGDPSPDGNTVSIEREMLEAVSVKREHDRALAIYKSSMKILRTSLGKS